MFFIIEIWRHTSGSLVAHHLRNTALEDLQTARSAFRVFLEAAGGWVELCPGYLNPQSFKIIFGTENSVTVNLLDVRFQENDGDRSKGESQIG